MAREASPLAVDSWLVAEMLLIASAEEEEEKDDMVMEWQKARGGPAGGNKQARLSVKPETKKSSRRVRWMVGRRRCRGCNDDRLSCATGSRLWPVPLSVYRRRVPSTDEAASSVRSTP